MKEIAQGIDGDTKALVERWKEKNDHSTGGNGGSGIVVVAWNDPVPVNRLKVYKTELGCQ